MKFGRFPVSQAIGGILAHGVRLPDDTFLKKGWVLDDELADLLHAASIEEVMVAIPEAGDIAEDEAATRIAALVAGDGIRLEKASTGRVNLFAEVNGLFRVDKTLVSAINALDPGITLATLADFASVNAGRMVATVKIIPYAVSLNSVEQAENLSSPTKLSVSAYRQQKIGLICTLLPGIKPSVLEKTRRNLEKRLSASNSSLVFETGVFHTKEDVEAEISAKIDACDMLIVFGASAVSDRRDVIPSAIEAAGGSIKQFGMPVDPGNLLLLGELNGKSVIGAPGCARSIAENGFDWVLQRLLANIPITSEDIAGLGVGGLLMETGARPHPREKKTGAKKVAAIVLAAGQSRRMGTENKLTLEVQGKPMVRHVVSAAIKAAFAQVTVVTGHETDEVLGCLAGLNFRHVENPGYCEGLSTSLIAGISSLDAEVTHAAIILGDMPFVNAGDLDRLIACSRDNPDQIIMATSSGKRGNPVLWPSRFFTELAQLTGDVGARHIIAANSEDVLEVEIGASATQDIDTPTALRNLAAPPDRA